MILTGLSNIVDDLITSPSICNLSLSYNSVRSAVMDLGEGPGPLQYLRSSREPVPVFAITRVFFVVGSRMC